MTKIEDRVTRLEREVEDIRRLASGAHEDVANVQATLRAHINTLEALHKNQREMQKDITVLRTDVDSGFAEMRMEFANVRDEMRTEFANVRDEMRTEFANVRGEMRTEFANVRGEMRTEFVDVRGEIAGLRGEMSEAFTKLNLGMSQITALLTIAMKDKEDD